VGLLVLLSLVPGAYRPHTGVPGDLEHLLAYGLTAAALALGRRSPVQIVGIILGLLVLASGLEVAQLFVPGRGASWETALVSGFGGVCGVVLGAGLLWGLQLREAARRKPARGTRVWPL
jgi:VanZ family protein